MLTGPVMLERALSVAVDAARAAGAAVRAFYKTDLEVRQKGENNPLTDADLASNAILEEQLRGAFPDWGWLSEETRDDGVRLAKREAWIVDPLDGTREFTLGLPEFVVSVGLSVEGRAVLGVLYNPVSEELFAGAEGLGVTRNGTPVRVSTHAVLDGSRVVASRSEMEKGGFDAFRDRIRPVPLGSVAYKFGLVAAGTAEATFTPRPRNEWDICAGVALVTAACGRATDRHGREYVFNQPDPLKDGVAATNGLVHDAVLGLMR